MERDYWENVRHRYYANYIDEELDENEDDVEFNY